MPSAAEPKWELHCEQVTLRRGERLAAQDVSLTLRPGECLSLIGPNGSGKTTLLLGMLGLLSPYGGAIRLDGRPMHRVSPRRRAIFAAYVPQLLPHLPPLTVYDVVAGGRFARTAPLRPLSAADREAIEEALTRCGLEALANRKIQQVSGGERQKTLLAAALAQQPQVLFLDEPSTALDPAYQIELARLLREWLAGGRGIVVVSHDLSLPAALGGRVAALREGRLVADGSTSDVLRVERLREIYDASFDVARTSDGREILVPDWRAAVPATA